MRQFWNLAALARPLTVAALAAPALLGSAPALASINFAAPYVFVTQDAAEKGLSVPLYGGSEREVSYVTVRVYRWVQKGEDPYVLEAAPEVAVFPQTVRLEPGARSDVRLAWPRTATPIDERYYRLVSEEFDRPGGEGPGKDKTQFGFRVRPRASLPLIVYGRNDLAPAQLSAAITTVVPATPAAEPLKGIPAPDNRRVRLTNSGQTYGRVLGFRDAKGTVQNTMVYVLPGSTVDIPVPEVESVAGLTVLYSSGRSEHLRKGGSALRTAPVN
ncbi:MAG: hypothetical protein RLZZ84_439 [Pseudomonadota bacterium]|jgi:P pilus assembly chaperone PapD